MPGQIALGQLSDRIGREWVWTIGNGGFVLCYLMLLLLRDHPATALLYLMVIAQGTLGYGLTSVMGPISAEIFEGRHYGSILGTAIVAAILGGAAGPWIAGLLHDHFGGHAPAFWLSIGLCLAAAAAIWLAAPPASLYASSPRPAPIARRSGLGWRRCHPPSAQHRPDQIGARLASSVRR